MNRSGLRSSTSACAPSTGKDNASPSLCSVCSPSTSSTQFRSLVFAMPNRLLARESANSKSFSVASALNTLSLANSALKSTWLTELSDPTRPLPLSVSAPFPFIELPRGVCGVQDCPEAAGDRAPRLLFGQAGAQRRANQQRLSDRRADFPLTDCLAQAAGAPIQGAVALTFRGEFHFAEHALEPTMIEPRRSGRGDRHRRRPPQQR